MPNYFIKLGKSVSLLLLFFALPLAVGQEEGTAQVATPMAVEEHLEAEESFCPADLKVAIDAIISRPQFQRSRWGILIQTLTDEHTLYALEAQRYFIPASNAKLLTTAAALYQLGSQYRIRTSVYGRGTLPNLNTLRIVGRGDPSLTTAQLKDLAQQLANQGVRQVQQLIVEESFFHPSGINPTWEWEDIQYYYGASVGSLILNQNAVTLTLLPQQPGQPVRLRWDDSIAARQWGVDNQAVTAVAGTPYSIEVTGVLGQPVLQINGQLAVDSEPDSWGLAVLDPGNYFLESFRSILAAEGITVVQGLVRTEPQFIEGKSGEDVERELAVVESPPLAVLLRETNQSSNNLYAEALLQILGAEVNRESITESGLTALKQTLTELGVDSQSYILSDGSGLSRHNLVSPEAIAQTLKLMAQTPQALVYRDSLPTAGMTGTLRSRFRDTAAQNYLQAKTGTLSGVSALSGYLDSPNYQPLVFSIMVNQSDQSVTTLRQAIDEIVLLLTRLHPC